MCLTSEVKREEHGEHAKCTFMQSAQVLSVHSSYPPVLDGAKVVKPNSGVDFLELKFYKQWKPTDGEGSSKKITEGVERSFNLIKNAFEATFGMKPQARVILLGLVAELKVLFHKLFVMEVNLFTRRHSTKSERNIPVRRARCNAVSS